MERAETVFHDPRVIPGEVWRQIQEYRANPPPSPASDDESTTPRCAVCQDNGWVRREVPVTELTTAMASVRECTACPLVAERRAARLFKQAQLPPRLAEVPPATDEQMAQYLPADSDRWLLLHGKFGVGKSWLAASLMRRYLDEQQTAGLFVTTPELLHRIRATYGPERKLTEDEFMTAVGDIPLLVLDDLGAERVTDWVEEKLFFLVNHRYDHRRRTVLTSNLSTEQLATHIGERTVWRLVEMAEVIQLTGKNWRLRTDQ